MEALRKELDIYGEMVVFSLRLENAFLFLFFFFFFSFNIRGEMTFLQI